MVKYDIATRTAAIMMSVFGVEPRHISDWTGIPTETVKTIYKRAIERGFDPSQRPFTLIDAYVADASRSGRPRKHTPELETIVLAKVRRHRYGREKTCAEIASELLDISATTVWRVLRGAGLKKTKPTRKPGLTDRMRTDRLNWCLKHQHWTLDDFKNVIWTDETSVILLHRRGGYQIWRTKDEAFLRSCIRERWKGSSEFMFWGSFSYDRKGPYHCWLPETAAERRNSEALIDSWNADLGPKLRAEWELTSGIRRINLRGQIPGRKPQWRFTAKTGKLLEVKQKVELIGIDIILQS
jgi:transposase